jgi:diguanylate cyclase (GGDEF)-like protein
VPLHNRLSRLIDLSADSSGDPDLASVGRRVVGTVVEITDFQVATVTVREGDRCRRLAAAGLDDPKVGLETTYADWEPMLQERFRVGTVSYLIERDVLDQPGWAQRPASHLFKRGGPTRTAWSENHGLVITLRDREKEIVGFLSVDAPRTGRLPGPDVIESLEHVAQQAQAVLVNTRLYSIADRQRRAAETLQEVIEAVSSSLDLREVLQRCCDAARHHSVGSRATIFLHDPDTNSFEPTMSRGISEEGQSAMFRTLGRLPEEHMPIFRDALEADEPVFVEDVGVKHLQAAERELYERFAVKSVAAYPLVANGRKVGILSLDASTDAVRFPPDERALMGQIARHAAMALRQARLHEAARDHASRVTRLHELTKAMTETFDFSTIFGQLSNAVRTRMDVQTVSVFELTDDRFELLRGDFGGVAETHVELPFRVIPLRGTLSGLLERMREDGSVVIDDLDDWPDVRAVALPETRSLLIAGHVRDDGVQLALVTSSTKRRAFDRADAEFMEGLVQVAALALRNSRLYEETREAAERDSLTGLKNRRVFWTELTWWLTGTSAERPTALAVIDVNDYKRVNDDYGHAVGDRVLHHVADRLSRSVRQTDTVYRIGGDEFAVIMPETSRNRASQVMDRAAEAVRHSRLSVPVPSLSVGIAVAPFDTEDGDVLFGVADSAMYEAKRRSKGLAPADDGSERVPSEPAPS